jgi:hypothetical protein
MRPQPDGSASLCAATPPVSRRHHNDLIALPVCGAQVATGVEKQGFYLGNSICLTAQNVALT